MESDQERFENELQLLQAIYPAEISFHRERRDLTFSPQHGKLILRIASDYPSESRPEVISATTGRSDLRNKVTESLRELVAGEEALDAICAAFLDLLKALPAEGDAGPSEESSTRVASTESCASVTMIIWLHHLLSTTKRKAILAPTGTHAISGVSKPGYPGVLIFSGPSTDVHEHVRTLRDMKWQAFQVRAEDDEVWQFKHGKGIVELETMGEVVEDVEEVKKQTFMEAMKMK